MDMTRVGKNPLRWKRIDGFPPVVAAVVTHLPNRSGYHAGRINVVKTSLISLRKHANRPVHVAVFDNGSCDALRDWLINVYKPETLVVSMNVGKTKAQRLLFELFPALTIINYSDDDMLYYPGWLDSQLKILDTYPESIVSCYPTRSQSRNSIDGTVTWAKRNARTECGAFMPESWLIDYCDSVGLKEPSSELLTSKQTRITYKGVEAFAGAHHCQFMAYAETARPFLKHAKQYTRGEIVNFDKPTDEAGILRLSTTERYARHIGNVIDGPIREDAERVDLTECNKWTYTHA